MTSNVREEDEDVEIKDASVKENVPIPRQKNKRVSVMEYDSDEAAAQDARTKTTDGRHRPPRPSTFIASGSNRTSLCPQPASSSQQASVSFSQQNGAQRRRRRRSSAKLMRLSVGSVSSVATHGSQCSRASKSKKNQPTEAQLTELYQRAIRMNAENRINASSSWNLNFIENMDRFLTDEGDVSSQLSGGRRVGGGTIHNGHDLNEEPTTNPDGSRRVNFTRASCTLDASVKIYSYRVDDVYLTSYKVLANLNRNDSVGQKKKGRNGGTDEDNEISGTDAAEGDENGAKTKAPRKATAVNTLETNVASINLSKLDSAFDIDPLFHKMSKTFDEGGAKGLLLANLGVGSRGCNIVFDSSKDESDHTEKQKDRDSKVSNRRQEGLIDISCLKSKLGTVLQDIDVASIDDLPLVPQLASLRAQYSALEEQGFALEEGDQALTLDPRRRRKSRMYEADSDEENLADQSIHQEALERSCRGAASMGLGKSIIDDDDDDDDVGGVCGGGADDNLFTPETQYGADDFGCNEDNYDVFGNFSGVEALTPRFSGGAPRNSFSTPWLDEEDGAAKATSIMLDTLSSNLTLASQSDYEYLDSKALSQILMNHANNSWAGALHWKGRVQKKVRQMDEAKPAGKTPKKTLGKKGAKDRIYVHLPGTVDYKPDLSTILACPPKRSALQLSKAALTKHRKSNNLLPIDAGLAVDEFNKLFLLPNVKLNRMVSNTVIKPEAVTSVAGGKTVGFHTAVEMWDCGGDFNNDNNDDDGPGFTMAGDGDGDADSFVCELDDVRKVEKVQVGYATVAKKVDVKKLKRDLWVELEGIFSGSPSAIESLDGEEKKDENMDQEEESEVSEKSESSKNDGPKIISFQDVVANMERSKTQPDITFPFYFICTLHLANEKGLRLDSKGLDDFVIIDEGGDCGVQLW